MRIAVCTSVSSEALIDEPIRLAAELALDGVVVWGREPHFCEAYDPGRALAVRRLVAAHGLAVAGIRTAYAAGAESPGARRAADIDHAVRGASELGAPLLTVGIADQTGTRGPDHVLKRAAAELAELCDVADARGMRVALEMLPRTLAASAEFTRRLLDTVARGNLGVAYQASPDEGGAGPLGDLALIGDRVLLVYAGGQTAGGDRSTERALLAAGPVDYHSLAARLEGGSPDRWVAIVTVPGPLSLRRHNLREDVMYLRSALQCSGAATSPGGTS